jgi:hypothetical protein
MPNLDMDNGHLASPELSEELYKLQMGRGIMEDTYWNYWRSAISKNEWRMSHKGAIETREVKDRINAYDTDYLLKLIPQTIKYNDSYYRLMLSSYNDRWRAEYGGVKHHIFTSQTNTPANTLCRLAIRLIKEGYM